MGQWDTKLKDILLLFWTVSLDIITLQQIKSELVFLQYNTIRVIQPFNQGIIKAIKCHYRNELPRKAAAEIGVCILFASSSVSIIAKSVSLLDAMHYVKMSWDNVITNIIKNCFPIANACKALHTVWKILDNLWDKSEIYSQYYCFARNLEEVFNCFM